MKSVPMACWLGLALVASLGSTAYADAPGDGLYGRFDGDLVLAVHGGGGVSFEGDAIATAELRARYLDSAGVLLSLDLGGDRTAAGLAIDLRPVFLGRFFLNAYSGTRFWDLLLDSIGLELGAAYMHGGDQEGVGLLVGVGVELPLLGAYPGLALRFGLRHLRARDQDRGVDGIEISRTSLLLTLALRTTVDTGLATSEPRRYSVSD